MDQQEDALALIQGLKSGSEEAFDCFYKRYVPFMYRIALHMMKDPMDAEDLCHDVFMEAIDRLDQYLPEKGSLEAWLAVRIRSRCLDRLRKQQHEQEKYQLQERNALQGEQGIAEQVVRSLEREALLQAMATLPVNQREAIFQSYFKEKSHSELAMKMQKPLGTVKSWIRYGLRNMRKQLQQSGLGGEGDHES